MQYRSYKNRPFSLVTNGRSLMVLVVLGALPNLLGMINVPTVFGCKIHFFQYAICMAALLYGPLGGLVSGGVGSIMSAVIMHNPYLIVGNMILGCSMGYALERGCGAVRAVMIAFAIQLPWLVITDVYCMKMAPSIVATLVVSLLLSDLLWAVVAEITYRKVQKRYEKS